MINVVINETGNTLEFKPDKIFEKYLSLTEKDVKKEFGAAKKLINATCPACKSKKSEKAFSRFGFNYVECLVCGSVYMNPRPLDVDIKNHYIKSASAGFWRDTLSKKTEGKRKEKIYGKRFQWFHDIAQTHLPSAASIADLNSKDPDYIRIFAQKENFKRKVLINPYFSISDHDLLVEDASSCSVIQSFADSRKDKGSLDIVCAFEAIDGSSDVDSFLKTIKGLLSDGGLCFLTTLSISGFDLQVLWENSTSIFPPDRINVLSRKGLESLFKHHGFNIIEYSTPGFLDLDIIRNAVKKKPSIELPRFVNTLLENGNDQVYRDFQDFLQLSKLSSFVRIVLQKQ